VAGAQRSMEKKRKTALRWNGEVFQAIRDLVAVEEPLEIRLMTDSGDFQSISITMRTPGRDVDLAVGFLFAEGVIPSREALVSATECETNPNVVKVELDLALIGDLNRLKRNFFQTSSCGVCGKTSLEALNQAGRGRCDSPLEIQSRVLCGLADRMREHQPVFSTTGGLHAVGLFSSDGEVLDCAEDVGRHNALDKLLGRGLTKGSLPWTEHVIVLSGRASFELVQKAVAAQVPVVASVGAPSSLAIELADEYGLTLIGFVKSDRFNVYTHSYRIVA